VFLDGSPVKKCVVLQVNDTAVSLRLVAFVSRYRAFIYRLQKRLDGGGETGEGCHPSDLLCWLTVIWSGVPTDSLGGGPQTIGYDREFVLRFLLKTE
jgi:hypothetical protein